MIDRLWAKVWVGTGPNHQFPEYSRALSVFYSRFFIEKQPPALPHPLPINVSHFHRVCKVFFFLFFRENFLALIANGKCSDSRFHGSASRNGVRSQFPLLSGGSNVSAPGRVCQDRIYHPLWRKNGPACQRDVTMEMLSYPEWPGCGPG